MKTFMKKFYELSGQMQEELLGILKEGSFERMRFPYQGKVVDGIIFLKDDVRYLVPADTIARIKPDPVLGADIEFSLEDES